MEFSSHVPTILGQASSAAGYLAMNVDVNSRVGAEPFDVVVLKERKVNKVDQGPTVGIRHLQVRRVRA